MELDQCLGNRIKDLFNPTANTIASQESKRKIDQLKTISAGPVSKKEEATCWFCSKKHNVMTSGDLISSSVMVKTISLKQTKFVGTAWEKVIT